MTGNPSQSTHWVRAMYQILRTDNDMNGNLRFVVAYYNREGGIVSVETHEDIPAGLVPLPVIRVTLKEWKAWKADGKKLEATRVRLGVDDV